MLNATLPTLCAAARSSRHASQAPVLALRLAGATLPPRHGPTHRFHPSPYAARSVHTTSSHKLRVEAPLDPSPGTTQPTQKQSKHFTYGLAAAYSGKTHRFNPSIHHFTYPLPTPSSKSNAASTTPPTHHPRLPSGQDSCFISSIAGNNDTIAFGLADGVGGWIEQKIDSGEFAHGICNHMADICQRGSTGKGTVTSPKELMKLGYEAVANDPQITGGGSTVCVGMADVDGNLRTANLGDSGYLHLRLNAVLHVSSHQTHAFNTPYQLSRIPDRMLRQIHRYGGQAPISDMPGDAATAQHSLRHGDVVVFATDGVWDNLAVQELLDIVSEKLMACGAWQREGKTEGVNGNGVGDAEEENGVAVMVGQRLSQLVKTTDPSKPSLQVTIATAVVEKAKLASINPRRETPFSRAVEKQFPGERCAGGKVDDICVVVAVAVDESA